MKKTIQIKPVPEIELCIDGGDSVLLRFDVGTIMELSQVKGGLKGLFKKPMPEMVATLIYVAAQRNNENYTLEDARALVSNMSVGDITAIMNEFSEAMGVSTDENNEQTKNLIAQFLKGI